MEELLQKLKEAHAKKMSKYIMPIIHNKYQLDQLLAAVSNMWMVQNVTKDKIVLKRVKSTKDIVNAQQLLESLKNLETVNKYFSPNNSTFMCQLSKTQKRSKAMGGGAQGKVVWYPDWRMDVVIKTTTPSPEDAASVALSGEYDLFEAPVNGVYKTDVSKVEVLTASMMNELAHGDGHSFSLFIPRFTAFYACPALHIVTEVIPNGTMRDTLNAFRVTGLQYDKVRELKVLMFQAIYTMISINKLGYVHQDSRPENFLVKNINDDEEYNGQNIGSASHWTLKMNDRSWKLPNVKKIAKLTDFGFTIRPKSPYATEGPFIELEITYTEDDVVYQQFEPGFRVLNEFRIGADVGHFLLMAMYRMPVELVHELLESLVPFWDIKQPLTEVAHYLTTRPDMTQFATDKWRTSPHLDNVDYTDLLDSAFFEDLFMD